MSEVADWLLYAENDLKTAKSAIVDDVTNNACLHAHQVAEKCLKAILLSKEKEVPKAHDLAFLSGKTAQYETEISKFKEAFEFLNQFYIPMRYLDALPGSAAEGLPTKQESEKAISFAEEILNFTKKVFESG